MTSQFAHIALYSRSLPKLNGSVRKWTVQDILAEASRQPEHSHHIAHPAPPKFWGIEPIDLIKELDLRAAASVDINGHRIRKDAKVLLAFVASWPERIPSTRLLFEEWIAKNLDFCKKKWGTANVKTLILHEDEMFPHVHIFVLPPAGRNGCFNSRRLHPGEIAKSAAAKGAETVEYKKAMRKFQDEYFHEVSLYFNLDRVGPRRMRTSRANAKINSLDLLIEEKEAKLASYTEQLAKLEAARQSAVSILISEDFLSSKLMFEQTGVSAQFEVYRQQLKKIDDEANELPGDNMS